MNKLRKWRQRQRLIERIDWSLFELDLAYSRRAAGNEYLERLDTLEKRRNRLVGKIR